ncbi:hypothetical protein [Aurantiacibacter rhizosphaerae]|uniref:Uncharacterized protein n=1 Tax=Aurantiacibacter rhizosphaerae TaxID=2691582 RepID=A0A844XG00_9SPHN|nr:hypothetical protein [Aurantiacibacter rhizosphaerae]MWV28498.1 hypothetical protein [Aurantiacibacter rhizosphaerae]
MLALSGSDSEVASGECLLGLKPALLSGGFTGSVDCQHDQLSIKQIGQIRTQSRAFTIYSYQFHLAPPCPECAVHGGHRIIFIEDGRYIRQYRSDNANVAIRHGNLFLEVRDNEPVRVEFTSGGPPKELLVDGEMISFFQ